MRISHELADFILAGSIHADPMLSVKPMLMRTITVEDLASLRDLRSRILEVGLAVQEGREPVKLLLTYPRLQGSTIESIWHRAIRLLIPEIGNRMSIEIVGQPVPLMDKRDFGAVQTNRKSSDAPTANYTYEVLRFLLNEVLSGKRIRFTPASVQQNVGASAPTIRRALRALRDAGVIEIGARGVASPLRPPSTPWIDLLARLGTTPPVLRFRQREGGRDMRGLLHRAELRMQKFRDIALSGAAAALLLQPSLDLVGFPRLDFLVRGAQGLAYDFIDALDAGLQPEPNPTAPVAVTITLTHAVKAGFRKFENLQIGGAGDIVLALEEARLYDIAHMFGHGKYRWD